MSAILTYTGRTVDVLVPDPEEISPIDIAHALSNLCRFTGHTRHFYSVAQHSVLVASLLPRELQFLGLMHDAAEAYVADMATPLKNLLPGYHALEAAVWKAICLRFGLPVELPPEVKHADLVALATEKRDLMPECKAVWPSLIGIEPSSHTVVPHRPEVAKFIWLIEFGTKGGGYK